MDSESLMLRTIEILERGDRTLSEPRAEGEPYEHRQPEQQVVRKTHTPRGPSPMVLALQGVMKRALDTERERTEARLAALEQRLARLESTDQPALRLVGGES